MANPEVTGRSFLRYSVAQKLSGMGKTMFGDWVEQGHVRFFKIGLRAVACWADEFEAAQEKMATEGLPCARQAKTKPPQKTKATRYQRPASNDAA
jgi:hypothetical protein